MSPGDATFGVEQPERHGILTIIDGNNPSSRQYPTIKPATYRTFYTELVKALSGQGNVPVQPEGPAAVIRLIELARRSSKEGKTLNV